MSNKYSILLLILSFCWSAAAIAAEPATPQFPAGAWTCGMGSYALRECSVAHEDGKIILNIPDGLGHRMPLRGEILMTDTDGQVVFDGLISGKYVDFDSDCSPSETTDPQTCKDIHEKARTQPIRFMLERKKDGSWRGVLPFFIVRGRWNGLIAQGWYRHGATESVRLVPAKRKQ